MPELCLDEQRAGAFIAGELPLPLRAPIEDHVDDCPSCRQLLAVLIRRSSAPSPAIETWQPGTRVGRHVVRERIGRGGMGEVFRAEDLELAREVALKRLDRGSDREALVREARAAAQLSHPNVVTVHEVGEADGTPFLAMEFVDGSTLTSWVAERTWREILAVLIQAGRGLAAAHARSLTHRDFKPDNVLVDRAGRARVADFGLARIEPTAMRLAGDLGLERTATSLAGTPAYLAPEILHGHPPDARSDQYAFGITAFEMLYGTHPFAGKTAEAMWAEMAEGNVRDVKRRIPAWLDRIVRRGLATKPGDRWPSVDAMVAALERGPRRRWPYVVGAAVIVNVAVVAFATTSPRDTCAVSVQQIDRAWNAQVRAIHKIRLQAAAPARGATIDSALAVVDHWTDAWRTGAESACRVDGEQRAAQLGCLDRGLVELHAELSAWRAPDAELVDRAARSASALPSPTECSSHGTVARLTSSAAMLLGTIAHVVTLDHNGRPREALPMLPALLAAAANVDPATRARALAAAGKIERQLGDLKHARDHDAAAARDAAAGGDDALTFRALVEESRTVIDDGHGADALGLVDAAAAVAARAHLDREIELAMSRGAALMAMGRHPEAIVQFQSAITLLLRDPTQRATLASAYGALGNAFEQQEKHREAIEMIDRGLELQIQVDGPDHPEVGKSLADLASAEINLQRFDDAEAHLQRAREIFIARFGTQHEMVAGCDIGLAGVARFRDDLAGARRHYDLAEHEFANAVSATNPERALVDEGLAWVDRAEDHEESALAHLEKATKTREASGDVGMTTADDEVELATVLWDLHRNAESQQHVERGLALFDQLGSSPLGHVNGWLVLSELEADAGHRAKAAELANTIVAALADDTTPDGVALKKRELGRIAELSK